MFNFIHATKLEKIPIAKIAFKANPMIYYINTGEIFMVSFLVVFIGGGFGSLCRYASGLLAKMLFGNAFPVGTLFVNLLGCFAIGYLNARFERIFATQEIRNLCVAGMLGGFTTFSAFGFETMSLFRSGSNTAAILNILLNVVLGILLAYAGFCLGRK